MENTNKYLALFPGQGSQKVGMGRELFDQSEIARKMFAIANEVLGFSLSAVCFEGPTEKLMLTENTQPAILTVSSICFEILKEKASQRGQSFRIAGAAGHSLGEYSALVAAGALRFEDAVALVNKRGRYMQEAVPAGQGKMIAVLGKEASEIEEAISKVKGGVVQIANLNAPGQIVVAGEKTAVDEMAANLAEAKVIELPVSAPFHCPLMKPAEEKLKVELDKVQINRAAFPVYSNYHAKGLIEPEDIREALRLQVCGQVRWIDSMKNAVAELQPAAAIEFGTGQVLSGMLKRIDSSVKRINVDGVESVEKILSA